MTNGKNVISPSDAEAFVTRKDMMKKETAMSATHRRFF
jgi:hypothetical protein